ncbi:hypothetical protein MRX96_004108 [Rhipicephalus microplus]
MALRKLQKQECTKCLATRPCSKCPYRRGPSKEEEQESAQEQVCCSFAEYSGSPPPSSVNQRTQTTTMGSPPALHTSPANLARPTRETVDDAGFQTISSKAAIRRTRNLTSAPRPVGPMVVGAMLYRSASAGGSFPDCPRLTIAQAL